MAYYGEYDSCQGRNNERIYESPPISGYGYQQQQQPPRPPCDPCLNVTEGGHGFNEYGGPAATNKYSAGGGYMMNRQKIIPQGQILRVCSKANPDYALAIRDGSAVMLFYNPNDPTMVTIPNSQMPAYIHSVNIYIFLIHTCS